jgi:hypothetical protein
MPKEPSSVSIDVKDDFFDKTQGHNDTTNLVIIDTTTTSRRQRRRRAVLCYISILVAVAVGFACSVSLFMSPHYDRNPVFHQKQSLFLRNNNNNSNNRRLERRGDPVSNTYEVENNNNSNNGVGGWFGKGKNNDNDASTTAAAAASPNTASYNSAYGSTIAGSSSTYGTYGSYNGAATGSSSGTGGNTRGYGTLSGNTNNGYGSYGSSSSYGGTSAYGSSSSSSSPGSSSSYSSRWGGTGSTATSSSRQWGTYSNNSRGGHSNAVKIDLFKGIFFLLLISTGGMLLTAHSMENDPEGTFANCCRVSLHTVNCVYSIIYNLYHCRLGEIPAIICGANNLEEDEYTDEELERMNLRPGIERALDVEHRKALRKVGVEMNMIKTSSKNGSSSKKNGASGGSGKSNKGQTGGTSIQR